MSIRRLGTLALVPIFLAACEMPEDDQPGTFDDDRPAEQDWDRDDDRLDREYDVGHEETVGLDEIRDSGISGEARFTVTSPNETQIMLEIADAPPNSSLTAQILAGTCEDLERTRGARGAPGEDADRMERDDAREDVPADARDDIPADAYQMDAHDELERVTTDAQGEGISTTTLATGLHRFKEMDHAVLVEDEQGQLVACGEINGGLTGAW